MRYVRVLLLGIVLVLAAPLADASAALPPVKHVFVIVLENEDAGTSFGAQSAAPYLATTLRDQGAFLPNYYGIGHQSLDNYIAMVSGQAPNPQTQADCQLFTDFAPGTAAPDGQVLGSGCVYPASVDTLAGQLTRAGLSWKGYMEDMGNDPAREASACGHPAIGTRDGTQTATATDQYATRHNPFVYFHSIIDDSASCQAHDVPLDALSTDLASAATTPSFSFITPDLCHDGHDATCADGGPGGLPAADAFLRTWVPRIMASPAFADGLLLITFDESESDSTACCGEVSGPNTPLPGANPPGPGGGRVGAVALSPYIAPGTSTLTAYNHYSLLRSLEDLWQLPHLGYAAAASRTPFGADVFTSPAGTTSPAAAITGAAAPAPASATPASGGAAPGATPACRPVRIRTAPRTLRRGTILGTPTLARSGGHRVLTIVPHHVARLTVHVRAHTVRVRVRACRTYRLRLPARGTVRVAAVSGRHSERRTVR